MSWIIKLFMPNATTLANYAAESIAKAINTASCKDQVAKYATIADQATDI